MVRFVFAGTLLWITEHRFSLEIGSPKRCWNWKGGADVLVRVGGGAHVWVVGGGADLGKDYWP